MKKIFSSIIPLMIVLLFMAVLFTACQNESNQAANSKISNKNEQHSTIQIWISKNFGQEPLKEREVPYEPKRSVMDYMQMNFEIETAYGGGFINSINGLKSGYTDNRGKDRVKKDWFYWLNGIHSPIGANAYEPLPGDIIWWDYHNWNHSFFAPAVIGAFPQPFVNGFDSVNKGTVIWYTETAAEAAAQWKNELQRRNVSSVELTPYSGQDLFQRKKITVLVGTWPELGKVPQIRKWLSGKDKSGIFARFADHRLQALRKDGTVAKTWESALLLTATGTGAGDTCPLWLVIGTDKKTLLSGLQRWFHDPLLIKNKAGVVMTDETAYTLPQP